jgi:hypothetical protein
MGAAQLGYFIGSFAMSLLFAAVWLIISKVIPPIRHRLRFSYGIAVVLAFLPPLITLGGPTASNLLGALLCAALLFWQYKRARRKLGTPQ